MNNFHDINLNIHYSAPDKIWEKIGEIYKSMPYWNDSEEEPHWMGQGIDLTASVESSGIQISGDMPDDIWINWYKSLKYKLSDALGYEIGEPEDGYKFKYWSPFVKEYADIKSIDEKAIIFNDYSTFYFDDIGIGERKTDSKQPYFLFKNDYMELRIIFNKTGLFSNKKNEEDYHELQKRLKAVGQLTRDIS